MEASFYFLLPQGPDNINLRLLGKEEFNLPSHNKKEKWDIRLSALLTAGNGGVGWQLLHWVDDEVREGGEISSSQAH